MESASRHSRLLAIRSEHSAANLQQNGPQQRSAVSKPSDTLANQTQKRRGSSSKKRKAAAKPDLMHDEDENLAFLSPLPTDFEADLEDNIEGERNNPFPDHLVYLPKRRREYIELKTGIPTMMYVNKEDFRNLQIQLGENNGRSNYYFSDLLNMPDYNDKGKELGDAAWWWKKETLAAYQRDQICGRGRVKMDPCQKVEAIAAGFLPEEASRDLRAKSEQEFATGSGVDIISTAAPDSQSVAHHGTRRPRIVEKNGAATEAAAATSSSRRLVPGRNQHDNASRCVAVQRRR
jgi:hypothetical protein